MITTEEQLDQAKAALEHLERALRALRSRVMAENPDLFHAMAEDYRTTILRMRSEIDAYLGLDEAGARAAPLWMVLEGETISAHNISSRLLAEWLERLRKSLYGMTAYLETGLVRWGGRPDAALLEATDLHVVAVAAGSIRVGFRLPPVVEQLELSADEQPIRLPVPHRALEQILSVAAWGASRATDAPAIAGANPDELSVAARFAAKLAPTQRGAVRSVTFAGSLVAQPEPLRLTAESRERLEGLVKMLSHVTEESITGQIREIDLDQRRIILRERGPGMPDVKCFLPEDLLPTAEQLLDKQVVVRGLISSATPDTMNAHSIKEVV